MLHLRGRLGTDSDFFRPFQPPESDATTCLFDRNKMLFGVLMHTEE